MAKSIIVWAAALLAIAVGVGAFGAHALKDTLSEEYLKVYQTGVQYHFYHALGMLLIGVLAVSYPSKLLKLAAIFLALGILLFSGSLYALAITGVKTLGIITPFGGVSFIAGWLLLIWAMVKK